MDIATIAREIAHVLGLVHDMCKLNEIADSISKDALVFQHPSKTPLHHERVPKSHRHSAPPHGLNFIRPTSARTCSNASIDVSGTLPYQLGLHHSTVAARPTSVWYTRSTLWQVSTKALCALVTKTLVMQALGFWSRRSGRGMVKMRIQRPGDVCFRVMSHELV